MNPNITIMNHWVWVNEHMLNIWYGEGANQVLEDKLPVSKIWLKNISAEQQKDT